MNPAPHRNQPDFPFGLIAWLEETRIVLPLKAVDVSFDVSGDLAEVSLDQIFHQTAGRPLDVTYSFPLPAGAAVFRCQLIVNDRVIEARVEEQAKAREIAREMKAAGHRVGLVEVERDNLFTLSLGNVQPDDLIVVRFAWFQALDHTQRAMALAIPFTPGVRYIPGQPLLRSNRGQGSVDDTDQVPDASRISPPRIDALHPDAALISLAGKMDARFVDLDSVSSATHPVIVRDETESLLVTLPPSGQVPDRDFVLRWNERAVEALDLRAISCVDDEARYAVVRLDAPTDAPVVAQRNRDYYFLVDRSGSMAGKKWNCTARALNAFVDELGGTDHVWITLFESAFQDFAEAPLPVAELKQDAAFRQLEKLGTAGGTELLPALEHVIKKISAHSQERDPVIIIITDGQVGNEPGVTKTLRAQRDLVVHTFGIDTAVNDAFLKQIAAQHRGACVLMTPNDDIQGAVRQLGNRLRRPVLTGLALPAGWEATCARQPDVHAGEHILVALKGPKETHEIALTGQLADGSARTFRFDLKTQTLASPRLLWARQAIDRLLADDRDADAIQLAIRHNVVCRGAAFIAYDLKEKVTIAKDEIYQPSLGPAVFGAMKRTGIAGGGPVAAAAPMPMQAGFTEKTRGIRISSPAREQTSSLADLLQRAKRGLVAVTTPPPRREFAAAATRLQEIAGRHQADLRNLRVSKKPDVRGEILATSWCEKASQFPLFQTEAGQLLLQLLSRWALKDPAPRFPLLNSLTHTMPERDFQAHLNAFIQFNITDAPLADDLRWLVDQIK